MTVDNATEKASATSTEQALKMQTNSTSDLLNPDIKLYKRRWLILSFYSILGAIGGFQWISMAIVEDALVGYYQVDPKWIEWTATIWSFTCIFLAIPGAWLVEAYGLRKVIVGCGIINLTGCLLKSFAGKDDFPLVFVGQTVASLVQAIALSLSPRLACVWFGPNEVSTASSLGILGLQTGCGFGFLIPPYIIVASEGTKAIASGLSYMNWILSGLSLLLCVSMIIWFQEKPQTPPSPAASKQIDLEGDNTTSFYDQLIALLRNTDYLMLLMSYGINMGMYCAYPTFLNVFILEYYPDGQKHAGTIGLFFSFTGMFGLIGSGWILDKSKKFKEVYLSNYILGTLSLLGFTVYLNKDIMSILYITAGVYGVFVAAMVSIGYEVANELTYPIAESTVNGIVVATSQIASVMISSATGVLQPYVGALGCLYSFVGLYVVGTGVVSMIPRTYKRLEANAVQSQKTAQDNIKAVERY